MSYNVLESAHSTLRKRHPFEVKVLFLFKKGILAKRIHSNVKDIFKQCIDTRKNSIPVDIIGLSLFLTQLVRSLMDQNKYDQASNFAGQGLELRQKSLSEDVNG